MVEKELDKLKNLLRKYFQYGFIVIISFALLSCSKEDDPDPPVVEDEFLLSFSELATFSQEQMSFLITLGGFGQYLNFLESGAIVYRISYKTTFKNEEISASGLVVLPDGDGTYPILSAHHGTIFSNAEAPSAFSVTGGFSGFEFFGGAGYITFIPDYIGYGDSKDLLHPYYNAQYTGTAVIDMIMAGKEMLDKLEVSYNDKLFLTGYSEGGYATVAVQKAIEETPSLNLSITASASGAGGYDIVGVMDEILKEETYGTPAYLAFVIYSYALTNDWTAPLSDFFDEPYASNIPDLFDGSLTQGQVNDQLTEDLSDLFNGDLLEELRNGAQNDLTELLSKNSVHDWAPESPLRIYHSPNDNVLPIGNSQSTVQTMMANGADDVQFVEIGGQSHGSAVVFMIEKVLPWFDSLK
ncbi:lipase family protein [Fulvivirgaceae bacterium BMA10]|uniref:Lipase family protein n=1 Tax=Splendidivirga corallicola TaxID=3051826 RepID=A0ABT8KQK6_9BACT|nr:lipase family protein [Fulvivirgaceae bacterium BMA10]